MRRRLAIFAAASAALLLGQPPAAPADGSWPGLRGPSHDGAVRDARLFEGDSGGLELAWKRRLGPGYPVVAADGERLVTAFQSAGEDVIAAFDPATGDELWRTPLAAAHAGHTGSHDGPIATPALAGGRVFGLGPRGQLVALDAADGSLLWSKHLAEELGAGAPFYGFATSPLVAGDVVVVQIGAGEGKAIAGFDAATGELRWSAGDDPVRYHSPVLATLAGRSAVVAAGLERLYGIDPATGELLWSHEHGGDERGMGGETIVPVPAGEDRILLLHSHPESVMLRIQRDGDGWRVEELWKSPAIKATYVLPVYHDGYLYGMNSKIFTCVDAATGETVWRSRGPGDGFPTLVGDRLVIMTKPGTLKVAAASPEGYRELASLELFDDLSWSAPAFAGGHIFARSMGELARVDPVAAAGSGGGDTARIAGSSFDRFLADLERYEDKGARIDAYLAANTPLPVVEPTGMVHFLYRGEARDVAIVGDMIGFRREDPMIRVEGTDLFTYSTRLELDAAVHYGFLVDYADQAVPDPLNPRAASGLFGDVSFFAMPGRRVPDYAAEAAAERQGRLEELTWESAASEGKSRKAMVYLPAGFDPEGERRYPTLYFHSGETALERGRLKNALDQEIGDSVQPLIAVFIMPHPDGPRGEMRDPAYTRLFLDELVPLVDERYPTIDHPMARASAGTVGGADLSLKLAFEQPERIGRVGAIWPGLFAFEGEVPQAAADQPLVIYQAWGSYHIRSPHENFDSAAANRDLWQRLRASGYRPAGGEVPEGFGWDCWRGYAGEMLRALFPKSG